ncbi:MAG: DUF342 domain-containing protein [SAR324 cluster bacterium]|nr:DUF342 domain-containing protein [SAR324 cluster bacterium]
MAMRTKTSLFQIRIKDEKILLRVVLSDTGEKASLDDIQDKLHEMDVDYLPETLLEIYEKASGKFEVLCDELSSEYQLLIEISDNELKAYLTIHPPNSGEDFLSVDRIVHSLSQSGVYEGINRTAIQTMLDDMIEYDPVVVAEGRMPVNGKDGTFEVVCLPEEPRKDPLHKDPRDMHFIHNVAEGETLVKIVPPSPGENGFTVTGKALHAQPGKKAAIFPGRNTQYNSDRTQIISTHSGFVCFAGNRVSVDNLLEISAVNGASGHVRFDGILRIFGDVEDGFSVEASSKIEIWGTVGKANVLCHGDIEIRQGIMGSNIKSGGTIQAGFISEAQVEAGEHLIVEEYILNSKVSAGKTLLIANAQGYFAGGEGYAGNFIKVPNAGSAKTQKQTTLEVGIAINTRKYYNELEATLEREFENLQKLKKNMLILQNAREKRNGVLPEEHEDVFNKMGVALDSSLVTLKSGISQWRKIKETLWIDHETNGGAIFVEHDVHPGVVIKVLRVKLNVPSGIANAAFVFTREGIQVSPFDSVYQKYKRHFP